MAARWDPFTDGFRLLERFGGRFTDGLMSSEQDDLSGVNGSGVDGVGLLDEEHDAFTPPANVWDDHEGRHIEVELPGVVSSGVRVVLEGDELVIDAERPLQLAGQRRIHHLEGIHGKLRRRFALPVGGEVNRIVARLEAGVLRVFIPRVIRSTTIRHISVNDGDTSTNVRIDM